MASTRSKSRSKGKDTSHVEARGAVDSGASVATERETRHMADDNEVGSIIEFTESIADQEAPVPLPKGDYPAEIRGAVRKTGATSGKDYAEQLFFIAPEAYPADYEAENAPEGTALYYRRISLVDTPAARHRIRRYCEAIGAPVPKTTLDLNEWIGRTATVTVDHETREGLPSAVITKVTAP